MAPAGKLCYAGPDHVGEEILCVSNVSFTYPDGTVALQDVSFHVQKGSTLAIVGPNGAGKTTLLKILLGLLETYQGQVLVAGMPPSEARRRGGVVSWVPQRQKMVWDFPVTVRHVVRMGLVGKTGLFRNHSQKDLKYVEELMSLLGIDAIADRPIGQVSGGQQQRAIIARALAPRPAILMLDEPTVGVDQAGQAAFSTLMKHIRQSLGVTLVVVSHDIRAAILECEQIACLNQRLHFHDSPEHLTSSVLSDVFRCDLTGFVIARKKQDQHPDHNHDDHEHPHPTQEGPQ